MRKYVSRWSGSFRVPARMMQWLEERLAGEAYKVQAIDVANMAMRVWCSPEHIGKQFPLSRPEVAAKLGLKDWETRKAIELLEKVGFLKRQNEAGKPRKTAKGIRRPPILYRLSMIVLGYFMRLLAKRYGSAPISNPLDEKISGTEGLFTGEGSADHPSQSLASHRLPERECSSRNVGDESGPCQDRTSHPSTKPGNDAGGRSSSGTTRHQPASYRPRSV